MNIYFMDLIRLWKARWEANKNGMTLTSTEARLLAIAEGILASWPLTTAAPPWKRPENLPNNPKPLPQRTPR